MSARNRLLVLFVVAFALALPDSIAAAGKPPSKGRKAAEANPYEKYVWPPAPDEPRIRLTAILKGRADVETSSKFGRLLLGAGPQSTFDWLKRPFAVIFDHHGRIIVSDSGLGALLRFDRDGKRLDVFGTTGAFRLKNPMGLALSSDGIIFVADIGLKKVVSFNAEGDIQKSYGKDGELVNPTDVAVSPDGTKVYVADSKAHKVVIYDRNSGALLSSFGARGDKEGEFGFPTSLAFSTTGELVVVDQLNARVQVFTPAGEYVTHFGGRGIGFGNFVRPKDVAFDEDGSLYVTDAAFSNVQIFDSELQLLTFVGEVGTQPGQFRNTGGVATFKDEFAVVDQLGARLEIFQRIAPKNVPSSN